MHGVFVSSHSLQLGVLPLHFIFRWRHDSHARETRLLDGGGTMNRCRGIATFMAKFSTQ